jgi:hypothetical protein
MRLAPRAALAAVLASALVLPLSPVPAFAEDASDSSYLVTFAAGTAAADQVAAIAASGATDVDAIAQLHLHSVSVPDDGAAAVPRGTASGLPCRTR